ncbi:vacuolar protein sorting-associated protein 35-domain-containing protein [Cladochytrium replicatum]|nr:vacuolar protein sorting-associated protein 35-domain-containing protein [Cladochytrium replicatum]
MSGPPTSPGIAQPSTDDQQKILDDALNVVKVQAFHMKRCLDNNKLMDALKYCSTMLSELRTSSLTPKNYYELYMAIFDELRHLTTYLYDAHMSHRHHLSDLYELVQYAGNIVPRLYLMITVGSVYMRVSKELLPDSSSQVSKPPPPAPARSIRSGSPTLPLPTDVPPDDEEALFPVGALAENQSKQEARKLPVVDEDDDVPPIKELMKDMLEMSRGVQHPTRGLFLRYYLSGMTRDFLPDGLVDGPHGSIHDSIEFILHNFIETNKLWVRLQHQGHSRERERREQERKELRLLVGSNLVRLSQLDSLDLEMYQKLVLPYLLDEIVSCRDVIAQEYLMEVIIQVFHDDFHLRTLDSFLQATAQLQRAVNVKQIVISLVDRFAGYAARARDDAEAKLKEKAEDNEDEERKPLSGIPEDVQLFDVFWGQVAVLVNARPEFTIQDITALLNSLLNLSLNCYPDRLDCVDKVLGFAKVKMIEAQSAKAPELTNSKTTGALLQLLLSPLSAYSANILTLLDFPSCSLNPGAPSASLCGNYTDLLNLQPFATRRQVAHAVATTCVRSAAAADFRIDSVEGVNAIFGELCSVMIREQRDGGLFGSRGGGYGAEMDWEDAVEEQNLVAKMVHLVRSQEDDSDKDFLLLSAARKHFGEGGDIRIRFTLSPLVTQCIKLARKYKLLEDQYDNVDQKLAALYKFIRQTVVTLGRSRTTMDDEEDDDDDGEYADATRNTGGRAPPPVSRDSSTLSGNAATGLMAPPEIALRLFLMSATSANEIGFEEVAYEFFVQALTMYEESISDSKAQYAALLLIISSLRSTSVFSSENYETLTTKCAVHCSRLLRRADQCRGVLLVSHLFERHDQEYEEGGGKRVLECLQKAVKIADSVMDARVNCELFIEILERCVWYFEKKNDQITGKYIVSLIELIQNTISTNLQLTASLTASMNAGPAAVDNQPSTSSLFADDVDTTGANANSSAARRRNTKRIPEHVIKRFRNVLGYVALKRDEELRGGDGGRRWGEIEVR